MISIKPVASAEKKVQLLKSSKENQTDGLRNCFNLALNEIHTDLHLYAYDADVESYKKVDAHFEIFRQKSKHNDDFWIQFENHKSPEEFSFIFDDISYGSMLKFVQVFYFGKVVIENNKVRPKICCSFEKFSAEWTAENVK